MMNWTGGRLQRHSKSNSNKIIKSQKDHFARARIQAQNVAKSRDFENPPQFLSFERYNREKVKSRTHSRDIPCQSSVDFYENNLANPSHIQQKTQLPGSATPKIIYPDESESIKSLRVPTIPYISGGNASRKEIYSVLSLQSLEATRRSLLDREDWLSVSAAKPLQINFTPPEILHRTARHRALPRPSGKSSLHLEPKPEPQCLRPSLTPAIKQKDGHTDSDKLPGNEPQVSNWFTGSLKVTCPSSTPARSRIDISTGSLLLEKFEKFVNTNHPSKSLSTIQQTSDQASAKFPQDSRSQDNNPAETVSYADMGLKFSGSSFESSGSSIHELHATLEEVPGFAHHEFVEERPRLREEPKQVRNQIHVRGFMPDYSMLGRDAGPVSIGAESRQKGPLAMQVGSEHEDLERGSAGRDHTVPARSAYFTPTAPRSMNAKNASIGQVADRARPNIEKAPISSEPQIKMRGLPPDLSQVLASRFAPESLENLTISSFRQTDPFTSELLDDDLHEGQMCGNSYYPAKSNKAYAQRRPKNPARYRTNFSPPVNSNDASLITGHIGQAWLKHVLANDLDQIQREFEFSATPVRRPKFARVDNSQRRGECWTDKITSPVVESKKLSHERRGRLRIENRFQSMREIVYSPILESTASFGDMKSSTNGFENHFQSTKSLKDRRSMNVANFRFGVSGGKHQPTTASRPTNEATYHHLLFELTDPMVGLQSRKRRAQPAIIDRASADGKATHLYRKPLTPYFESIIDDVSRKRRALETPIPQVQNTEHMSIESQAPHLFMSPGRSETLDMEYHEIVTPFTNFKIQHRGGETSMQSTGRDGHRAGVAACRDDIGDGTLSNQRLTLQADLLRSRVISQTPSTPHLETTTETCRVPSSLMESRYTGRLTMPSGRGKLIQSLESPTFRVPSSLSKFASI